MLNTDEQWVPIPNYEKLYEVSNHGKIRNNRERILKTYTINSGYDCLKLTKDGTRVSPLVHRLVATSFIPNPDNLPEVNHKDCDKHNNHVDNLEWVSSSDNKQHAIAAGRYECLKTARNSLGKKHFSTASKYHNVGFDKSRNKWKAAVRHEGKTWYQKRFTDEDDAARHVNWVLEKLGLSDRPRNIIC